MLPLSYLPNQQGFSFIAVFPDKEEVREIKINESGLHYVDDFSTMLGWKRLKK